MYDAVCAHVLAILCHQLDHEGRRNTHSRLMQALAGRGVGHGVSSWADGVYLSKRDTVKKGATRWQVGVSRTLQ